MNDIAQTMADLAARAAIRDKLYHYCRAMDRIDPILGYAIWHDDARVDYGPLFQGSGRDFVDWVCALHRGMNGHSHQITNILIALDADRAASEAYVTATLRRETSGVLRQTTIFGRYLDRWERREGRWAIIERRFLQDLVDERTVDPHGITGGHRSRADPSYDLLPPDTDDQ